jgi:hypothetical protein
MFLIDFWVLAPILNYKQYYGYVWPKNIGTALAIFMPNIEFYW